MLVVILLTFQFSNTLDSTIILSIGRQVREDFYIKIMNTVFFLIP